MSIFKRINLAALFMTGILAAIGWQPATAGAADLANGRNLYMAHCSGCHGDKGISFMPQAPNLARGEGMGQPDPLLIDKIRAGKNAMPPFLGILSDRDILDVIAYARTLL